MRTLFNIGNRIVFANEELVPLRYNPSLYIDPLKATIQGGESGSLYTLIPVDGGNIDVNRDSKKYVFGKEGFITEVTEHTPAFEFTPSYNPDWGNSGTVDDNTYYPIKPEYKGIFIEEQSTNLVVSSSNFDKWNTNDKSNIEYNTNDNAIFNPDGSQTTFKFVVDANLNSDDVKSVQAPNTITFLSGFDYTLSVFARADEMDTLLVRVTTSNESGDHVENLGYYPGTWFDLLKGTVHKAQSIPIESSSIEYYGNGWYRCSMFLERTSVDINDKTIQFRLISSSRDTNGDIISDEQIFLLPDGDGLYLWGAQIEKKPFSTSYIPTLGTQVTRFRDNISKTNVTEYIGQTSGTIYAEVQVDHLKDSSYILQLNNSTDAPNWRIYLGNFNPNFNWALRYGSGNSIAFSTPASTGNHKLALVYTDGIVRAYLDGTQVGTTNTTSWGDFTSNQLDTIHVGASSFGGSEFNNYIKDAAIYKHALTDIEAKELTTL